MKRTLTYSRPSDFDAVDARVDDDLVVELECNPSTGYRWTIDEEREPEDRLRLPTYEIIASGYDQRMMVVGAPCTTRLTWTSQMLRESGPGNHHIVLLYRRPWDKRGDHVKKVELDVHIHED